MNSTQNGHTSKNKVEQGLLWTGDVARYCGTSNVSVARWIKKGELKAFRTPGGRFRIRCSDFVEFLRKHDFPIPLELVPNVVPRILIVEDDPQVAWMLEWAIRNDTKRYSVAVADSGFRAAYLVFSFRPDLIVLDIRLPGLDGVEVCKIVKGDPSMAHAKIVVVSAYLDDETACELKDAGAEVLLPKPVDVKELRQIIEDLLIDTHRESAVEKDVQEGSCAGMGLVRSSFSDGGRATGY